ncbi:helix-turn-helix transcriptional regulator [Roseimicrobium gellanilyticum]|nr:AraC family transcriptional regulator [Roseimicrobium gellanilyticum]
MAFPALSRDSSMLNLYDAVRDNPSYSKLVIGDFLFAEYTCGTDLKMLPNWTEKDYFVHVVTGKKTWHTPDGVWTVHPGETVFFKKGATVAEQHFEVDVCMLMVFIPDTLMRSTVREVVESLNLGTKNCAPTKVALRVESDVALAALFQSMRTYLVAMEKPPEPLVRLKLKELVMSVLTSGTNAELAAYFCRVAASDAPGISEIMEANFRYNLSMEEYAKLCHRSLSSFKRDFHEEFQESPGKWLLQRRLDHAANLLRHSRMNITEVALESGFEHVSHFSRVFKERFGVPPLSYRQEKDVEVKE